MKRQHYFNTNETMGKNVDERLGIYMKYLKEKFFEMMFHGYMTLDELVKMCKSIFNK